MMWIKRVEIANIGVFEHFEKELTRGSIGVFGRNGSGKSTFTNLLYAAIGNDFGRFAGAKSDVTRLGMPDKARAYVCLDIEHNNQNLRIRRGISPNCTEVRVDGGEVITDSNKAQVVINELLGCDSRLLNTFAFKTQDRIYDFLVSTPAERARAYQLICRTGQCETVHKLLGEHLARNQATVIDSYDNSDELRRQHAALATSIASLESQAEIIQKDLAGMPKIDQLRTLVADRQTYLSAVADCRQLREQLETANTAASKAAAAAAELLKQKKAADAAVVVNDREVRDAEEQLQRIADYRDTLARRDSLDLKLSGLKKEISLLPALAEMPDLESLAVKKSQLAEAVSRAEVLVETFNRDGVSVCPTCETPVSTLRDRIDETDKSLPGLRAALRKITAEQQSARKLAEDIKANTRKAEQLARAVTATEAAIREIEVPPRPEGDEVALRKIVAARDNLRSRARQISSDLATAEIKSAKAAALAEAVAASLTEASGKKIRLKVTRKEAEDADRFISVYGEKSARLFEIAGELKGLRAAAAEKKKELTAAVARVSRLDKERYVNQVIAVVHDATHWSNLPSRVAAANMAAMAVDINRNLASLGHPFWVEADASLSFIAHKPGSPPQPAAWLSTGQKVILALAFWPAVAALWGSDLGVLVLDEPTANLDTENRQLLAGSLREMTARLRGNRQLIMVTHDQDLRSAFDQVIDLGSEG